jgi:hypothetical protein
MNFIYRDNKPGLAWAMTDPQNIAKYLVRILQIDIIQLRAKAEEWLAANGGRVDNVGGHLMVIHNGQQHRLRGDRGGSRGPVYPSPATEADQGREKS